MTLNLSVGKLKTSLLCSIHVCIPYNIVYGQVCTSCTSSDKIQVDRPYISHVNVGIKEVYCPSLHPAKYQRVIM